MDLLTFVVVSAYQLPMNESCPKVPSVVGRDTVDVDRMAYMFDLVLSDVVRKVSKRHTPAVLPFLQSERIDSMRGVRADQRRWIHH